VIRIKSNPEPIKSPTSIDCVGQVAKPRSWAPLTRDIRKRIKRLMSRNLGLWPILFWFFVVLLCFPMLYCNRPMCACNFSFARLHILFSTINEHMIISSVQSCPMPINFGGRSVASEWILLYYNWYYDIC